MLWGWCVGSQEVVLEIKVRNRAEGWSTSREGWTRFRAVQEETDFEGLASWISSHPSVPFIEQRGTNTSLGQSPASCLLPRARFLVCLHLSSSVKVCCVAIC